MSYMTALHLITVLGSILATNPQVDVNPSSFTIIIVDFLSSHLRLNDFWCPLSGVFYLFIVDKDICVNHTAILAVVTHLSSFAGTIRNESKQV